MQEESPATSRPPEIHIGGPQPSKALQLAMAASLLASLGVPGLGGGLTLRRRPLKDNVCIQCNADIPPGRNGRKCRKCRGLD